MRKLFVISIMLLTNWQIYAQWTQVGSDIEGVAYQDRFGVGTDISSGGNRVVVGAYFNDANGNASGQTRVFELSGTSWNQLGLDINGPNAGDAGGRAVRISSDGSRIAVGYPGDDNFSSNAGTIRLFDWNGTAWTQVGGAIDGTQANDAVGNVHTFALSGNGNRVAVGAPVHDQCGGGPDAGLLRVFEWSGTAWTQMGSSLCGSGGSNYFGGAVDLDNDGDRMVVSATGNDASATNAGQVQVFDWSGTAWIQVGGDINGEAAEDRSGIAVDISNNGNTIAIGASLNDGSGVNAGHVRVFNWSGTVWNQLGIDIDGEAADDRFGGFVSLSSNGGRLAVGAIQNDGTASNAGHVRVLDWTGTAWTQIGADIDGEAGGDQFGNAVALSSSGSRVVSGAPFNDGFIQDAGHARVFNMNLEACQGNALTFTAFDTTAGNTYDWDWGDASTHGTNKVETHTYATADTFIVTLTIIDASLCASSSTLTVIIHDVQVACSNDGPACQGSTVSTATATPSGGDLPYTYLWDDPGTQTTATATNLAAPGTYSVTVTDPNGCTATCNTTVVALPLPDATFVITK